MKQTILLFTALFLVSIAQSLSAQPYAIGSRSMTFTDASRSNRSIATTIYYPATTAGSNQPFVAGTHPVVVFGHGFSMGIAAFTNIWNFLAPQGYVVVMVNTETGTSVSHSNFGLDLAFCAAQMQTENANTGSPFFGKLTNKTAIMGHSMGGGCSFLASANNPVVTTVVGLAPAETNPSAAAAAANITAPILILAGENDCVTPAADHNLLIYNGATATTCKYYVVINDGIHCDFTNGDGNVPFSSPAFNCYFGGSTCGQGNGSSTNQPTQQARMEQAVLPWLNYRLKGNCAAWATFQSNITNTTSFSSYQQSCTENPFPTATLSPSPNTTCIPPYSGTVSLTTDGTSFLWSNGLTTQNINSVNAGTYSVTVTKSNGCTATATTTVANNVIPPTLSITPSNNTNCIAPFNGAISLSTDGASFLWSNGLTTQNINSVNGGNYSVTVTKSNGCTATGTTTVNNNPILPTVSMSSSNNTNCESPYNGTASVTAPTGTGVGYLWSNGATTRDITSVSAGTYSVTVTDVGGCTNTGTATIVNNFVPCNVSIQAKVWLQGAYNTNTGKMDSILRNNNLLPVAQPYNAVPWNYIGTENAGSLSAIPTGVTDWVLVELRNAADSSLVARKAVWLLTTGWLRDVGALNNNIQFNNINTANPYFVSIRHRNHLDILSNNSYTLLPSNVSTIDFTQVANVENGATQLVPVGSAFAMIAGDNDGNGRVNAADFTGYVADTPTGINNYAANAADHDLNRVVNYQDFNLYTSNVGKNAISILRY